jgi:indole-3-glycerol phosphate synthase
MTSVLERICADRRTDVERAKAARPMAALIAAVADLPPCRGFAAALARRLMTDEFALIAELKRASPSRGLIRAEFDPVAIARAYVEGGSTCLSVLTERKYFQGDGAYLAAARAVVPVPLLCKDFILDPYQVVEARVLGADCVLLIIAALDDSMAAELAATAAELGLDVLVEVHDERELDRALRLATPLIGINNRNLATLAVDLGVTERLAPRVPGERLIVGESGLSRHQDLVRLAKAGVRAFLVGESLMREADVASSVRTLLRSDGEGEGGTRAVSSPALE